MSGHSSSEGAEPNLTPMLDMVFQLVTFFMLVINFKGASMDLSLKLPVLGSARPLEYQGQFQPLMLNINTLGKVQAFGQTIEVEPFVKQEARLLKLQLESSGSDTKDKGFPVPVIIRANENVTVKQLNAVIETCQKHGYEKFSLSMVREE